MSMEVEEMAPGRRTAEDNRRLAAEAWGYVERYVRHMDRRHPQIEWSGWIAERICSLIGTFDPRRFSLRSWALMHAAYAVKDAWRDRQPLGFRRGDDTPSVVSYDALMFEDDHRKPQIDALAVHDPKPACEAEENVRELLRDLTPNERHVLWEHAVADRCLKEIGRDLGVSRSRAQQIHADAIGLLRDGDRPVKQRAAGVEGRPKAPDIDAAEAERLYREGRTLDEVGRALGCSHSLVQRRLVARGVEIRPRGVRSRIDAAEAHRLYSQGHTLERIGGILGCSADTVRARLVARGVAIRKTGWARKMAARRFRRLVAQGLAAAGS